ncbi:MAG: DUF4142 domain-containing protein [Bryobacteraceae bacterium]
MRRATALSFVFAGAFLCVQLARSQAPGQSPTSPTTPSTFPGRTSPGQPGVNGPMGPESTDTMPAKMDDKKFAKDAALGGLTEVQLGKLAAERASRDDIKQFGQRLAEDHTKANEQLKQLAGKQNISLPDALDSKHQARVDKLAKLSGSDFEKAFIKDQVKDHEMEIRNFTAEAQSGTDPEVKTYASNVLPTLQEHLQAAKNLNKSEKHAARQAR